MREDFLFDSNDKKQHGVGVDRLGGKGDGLKYKWESVHHQIAYAVLGNFKLKTIYWHTYYEAELMYRDNCLESSGEVRYKSKISAQIAAEKLFADFIIESLTLKQNQ